MANYLLEVRQIIILTFNKYFCSVAEEDIYYIYMYVYIYYKDSGFVCIRAVIKNTLNSNYWSWIYFNQQIWITLS